MRAKGGALAASLARGTPAYQARYRPAPRSFTGQLWAALTRNTPAYTKASPESTPDAQAGRLMTRIFSDPAQADAFARDPGLSLALAIAMDRLLAVELARKLAAAIYYDADRARNLVMGTVVDRLEDFAAYQLASRLGELKALAGEFYRLLTKDGDLRNDDVLFRARRLPHSVESARRSAVRLAQSRVDQFTLDSELYRLIADAAERADGLTIGIRQDLTDADLRGARLSNAELTGSDLSGTDLRDANLTHADLQGALWSLATSWPIGMLRTMEDNSTEIKPGFYRVNTPRDRDRSNSPVAVR
jgi:Pentapeptide repeats (8 copies)